MPTRRTLIRSFSFAALPSLAQPSPLKSIQHIDIIHHSHTDVGFTDMPSVTRDLQVRFLDAALEACLRNPSFRWTAEAMITVDDWWRQASAARRDQLLAVVHKGQMDMMALPFNQAPFMNAAQWRQALDWLPEAVRKQLNPRAGMQNDVNGFPRAGALHLLDRGITHLLMGINVDMGGVPFRRPAAFYWKMPDGRRLFVWLGDHYGTAYAFFEAKRWQHGQAKGATTTLRPPYSGDHLRTDSASLQAAQAQLWKRLQKLEEDGYSYPRLILSYTNQWRYDNDPPFPPLAPFVDAWNKAGLMPAMHLTTATEAVHQMEKTVGASIATHEGEWTDWWANGDASGPREVAASRVAKRYVSAALSPLWGAASAAANQRVSAMLRDLCLFDEHTWGANVSVSQPDSLDTIAQFTEKSLLAYRPMGHSEWLLGQRARRFFSGKPAGTYVVNATGTPYTGWVRFQGLSDPPVWVRDLKAHSFFKLGPPAPASPHAPRVEKGSDGWPVSAAWAGMSKPLFGGGVGDLLAVSLKAGARRSSSMHPENLVRLAASYGEAKAEETPYTLVFTQPVLHPRLENATRRLELFREQARARLTVRFDRISSMNAEALYILNPLPVEGMLPRFSNGGVPFTPFTDQIPGACRDYFAIDGWAHYATPQGHWLWVTRDAPLVTVGGPHTWQRIQSPPADPHRLWAMVFDNFWHTNFVANSHGAMEFHFEFAWMDQIGDADAIAGTMVSEPVAVVQPAGPESPELLKSLFTA